MHELYEATALTPMRVARLSGYIDWASQPVIFKHYPGFLFRYPFGSNAALRKVELARAVTSRTVVGGRPYCRLNAPSAGNLHPVELYVQVRGVKGVLSGIYHVDADAEAIVLLREIEGTGIEPEVGLSERFEGMIFIVSSVPYRSEWKYGERALRYCYLDAGHQIGAVQAAAALFGQDATILSGFEAECLNAGMGFSGEEFACAAIAVGHSGSRTAARMTSPLMRVQPTDYCETKGDIPRLMAQEAPFEGALAMSAAPVAEEVIKERRSARHFSGAAVRKGAAEHFMHLFAKSPHPLHCFTIVLQSESAEAGIYADGEMLRGGLFTDEAGSLLVDQHFVKKAAMVAVITARVFGPDTLMAAGAFAHQLSLEAEARGLGFTGIGAFHDRKLQRFLSTESYILYVCALGEKK